MTRLMRQIVVGVGLALIVASAAACVAQGNPLTSPTEFDSMVPGWQSKFSLDWKVAPAPDGTSRLYGRVSSHYGENAAPFRVLAMTLDASGKVIGQRIQWVPGGVPGFGDAYFEVDRLVAGASYRVTVWDYTFIEARGTLQ